MGRRDTKNICSKVFMPEQLRGGLVYTKIQYCPVRGYSAYMSTEATMPMICCDTVPEQIVGKEHPKMVRPLPRRSLTEVAGGHQRQGRAIFLAGSVFPIFLAGFYLPGGCTPARPERSHLVGVSVLSSTESSSNVGFL